MKWWIYHEGGESVNNHCVCCGTLAKGRLCPDCRAEVDARARGMMEERMTRELMRGRVRR